ncbi:hypothetical protein Kisp01_60260 [Kineosporia sp. NBRC 101677]|uniref:hypothetical protein n=1 Tax=Kineosporia sp. NBRC 101677 TaxID=3032197 RepID=UPI00249FA071|nr:hypothetical protein [Kineosporia sp. NBRC 101677]GLY19012.1 hypothetical protein Kisp01_60260 [Kineosporia sp. NBRC 101677]
MSETIADVAVGHAGHDQAGKAGTTDERTDTVHDTVRETVYEYATVQAPRRLEWVYRDAYRHLGWLLDAFDPDGCRNPALVTLRFRRDLALPGRAALAGLQRECDEALAVIAARERVRTSLVHSSTALSGIVGAGLVAGAALTLDDGDLLTPVLLVALGVVVWLIGVIGRRHLAEIAAARFGLGIEKEYAVVLRTGEQAAQLLARAGAADRLELIPAQP